MSRPQAACLLARQHWPRQIGQAGGLSAGPNGSRPYWWHSATPAGDYCFWWTMAAGPGLAKCQILMGPQWQLQGRRQMGSNLNYLRMADASGGPSSGRIESACLSSPSNSGGPRSCPIEGNYSALSCRLSFSFAGSVRERDPIGQVAIVVVGTADGWPLEWSESFRHSVGWEVPARDQTVAACSRGPSRQWSLSASGRRAPSLDRAQLPPG